MTDKRLDSWNDDDSDTPRLNRVELNRRRFLRLSIGAAGVAAITPLLAACGSDDDEPEAEGQAVTETTPSTGAPAETEATEATGGVEVTIEPTADTVAGLPQTGGELVVGNEQNPVSLDPHYVRDVGSSRAMFYMYDSLIEVDAETELEPWLATAWEVSDDGMQITLQLQEGVTFHDGTPFNAEAVKFNLERHWDESLNTNYHDDFVQYLGSVDVIDDATVQLNLKELFVLFPREFLAFGSGHMISPTVAQELGEDFAQQPVGTGPFKYQEFIQDSHLVMTRNDDYWAGAPHLDSLRVRVIPEQGVQIVELEAGNLDVGFSVQAKDVERLEQAGVEIINQPPPTATWISMNLAKGYTRELPVRQAIALSVDREAIVSELLLGFGQVSRGGSPEGWPRYHEDIPMDEYDPEEAGRILDEAGWVMGSDGVRVRDGERLKVNVLSTQLERALSYGLMNDIIAQSLNQIGIETEMQTMEWGAYLDEFRAGEWWEVTFHAQNANARELVGAAVDPDAYWNVNQLGKVTEGELVQVAEQVRELYSQMEQSLDPQERIDIWKEVQLLIHEHKLLSWLVHWDMLVGVQPRVKDLIVKPVMSDTLHLVHQTWIDLEA